MKDTIENITLPRLIKVLKGTQLEFQKMLIGEEEEISSTSNLQNTMKKLKIK